MNIEQKFETENKMAEVRVLTRVELRDEIRKIARIRNIPKIALNRSNVDLRNWITNNSRNVGLAEQIATGITKLEKSKQLKARILAKNFLAIFTDLMAGVKLFKYQAEDVFNAMIADDQRYLITLNSTSFPANPTGRDFIIQLLRKGFVEADENDPGSDRQKSVLSDQITFVNVELLVLTAEQIANRQQDGAYFSRLNSEPELIDLERYQIFSKAQESENCLIHTLKLCEIPEDKINAVKLAIGVGTSVAKKSLTKIAEIINTTIEVHEYDKKAGKVRKYQYKNKNPNSELITIALYSNHYFIMEPTKYSKYAITNREALKIKNNWYDYHKSNEKSASKYKLNSLNLILQLDHLGLFYYGDMSTSPEGSVHIETRNSHYLDMIVSEQREVVVKPVVVNTKKIYYADCETFVSESVNENGIPLSGKHQLFLLGFCGVDDVDKESVQIYNFAQESEFEKQNKIYSIFDKMTNYGSESCIVYFHNLKYDYNILEAFLNIQSVCKKDNRLYSVKVSFKKCIIELRDSAKIASMQLSEFCKNFDLPKEMDKLEAINYAYYTVDNSKNTVVSTHEYARGLPVREQETFWETVGGRRVMLFDPIEYYITYLRMDCLVLKFGMEKFDSVITSIDERLSIHNCLTISSLTDHYMYINGAYDGVYENTGNLRDYISKAVYGGRVHVNQKYLKKVVEEKIADYDGVSLYPSAINRLCRERGLPMGAGVRISENENGIEAFCDAYAVLTVLITKVGKKQQMPIIAVKSSDSIKYTNDIPTDGNGKPLELVIDLYTLQDYIEFHEIEYKILDGVVWRGGTSDIMGGLIRTLFEKRSENKHTNPGLANVLKLMLNSAYGKTITRKSTTQTRIIQREKITFNKNTSEFITTSCDNYKKYIYKNFNTTKKIRAISSKFFEVEQLAIDTSYNRGHIGCAILSYSKRIMNEVFTVANDGKLPIYYTDTDSIHMRYDDVPKLEKAFTTRYNKKLTGAYLEQFHIDFKLKGAEGNVWSTKFLALGKKSYCDELEGRDKNGGVVRGVHTRLKGITEAGIEHHSKEYKNGVFGMFEELALGEPKTIILNPFDEVKNYQKPIFHYVEGGVKIRSSASFTRKIKF
jgi:hypothetical protein